MWVGNTVNRKLFHHPLPGADAALSDLSVSPGTLTPVFARGTLEYTVADVPNADSRITVTATPETGATVAFEDGSGNTLSDADAGTAGDQFDLEVGENTIKVTVTKGDATQTYTLRVTRAATSSDATLSALSLSAGTLTPAFASGTIGYTASVAIGVTSTTVTATQNDAAATVVITPADADADANAEGHQVSLNVGSNTVTVTVTATGQHDHPDLHGDGHAGHRARGVRHARRHHPPLRERLSPGHLVGRHDGLGGRPRR